MNAGAKTISLCMIVKNVAHVIHLPLWRLRRHLPTVEQGMRSQPGAEPMAKERSALVPVRA
jgi:hypothetical protein